MSDLHDPLAPAGPAVVLVRPQLAENVGTAARAMYNCGLTDMRLVAPREDWLADKAIAASSGAEGVLRRARAFDSVEAAVADLRRLYATTARRRDMIKPVATPRRAAAEMRHFMTPEAGAPQACGILFGPERTGLSNDDVALADLIVEVPLNPAYCSLNLAQAVLLMGYEWFQAGVEVPEIEMPVPAGSPLATRSVLDNFHRHLIAELDDAGFLRNAAKRPGMERNIRAIFQRAALTEQEVRTLHGIVKELRWGRRDGQAPDRQIRGQGDAWREVEIPDSDALDGE